MDAGGHHLGLFWRMGHRTALRQGDWKIVWNGNRSLPRTFELYRLDRDISETRNLAAENPRRLEDLASIWADVNRRMADPD